MVDAEAVAACFNLSPEDIWDDYPIQWVSTGLESVTVSGRALKWGGLLRCTRTRRATRRACTPSASRRARRCGSCERCKS